MCPEDFASNRNLNGILGGIGIWLDNVGQCVINGGMNEPDQKLDACCRRWSWGRVGLWLVGGFSLSVALHVLLIVCHLDNPGAWWWVGSTLLMLLFLLLLGLWVVVAVWMRRRWRECALLLGSLLVLLWGYRGITPPTEYCVRLWCCNGATIRPTWHISPLKRLYYACTTSLVDGRDGLELWVNDIEATFNYSPVVGHGPFELIYQMHEHYEHRTYFVSDSFTLILPRDRAATEVPLQLAADTSALGVIVLSSDEQYEQINLSQNPIETAREQGLLWLPVTAENKGSFRLPLTGEECHFVVLYRCTNPEFDPRLPWLPYVFNIRRLPEPWMR